MIIYNLMLIKITINKIITKIKLQILIYKMSKMGITKTISNNKINNNNITLLIKIQMTI